MKGRQGKKHSLFSLLLMGILLMSFSHSGLTISVEGPAMEDNAHPLLNLDGQIQLMPEIPELEDHSDYLAVNEITGKNTGLIFILVDPGLYPDITYEINRYVSDVTDEGYNPEVYAEGWADEFEVRSLLQSGYQRGMVGSFLVGDIPVARYEIANDYNEYGYAEFPIDLFYMDIDGDWIDSDVNGIFDDHFAGSGDIEADIWVGRLYASTITIPGENELSLIKNYFDKNHEYRMGNLSLFDRALVYVDDDWIDWSEQWDSDVGLRYENRTFINDPEKTTAPDYLQRIVGDNNLTIKNESYIAKGNETGFYLQANETNPDFLGIDCIIEMRYVWEDDWSSVFILEEGTHYFLNASTGWVDTSWSMWLGDMIFTDYDYIIDEFVMDRPISVVNESVYVAPDTSPIPNQTLAHGDIINHSLWYYWGDWNSLYKLNYDYYSIDNETGVITFVNHTIPFAVGDEILAYYNYSGSLSGYYDWVSLFAHSAYYYHGFYIQNQSAWSNLFNNEISGEETMAHFYNLFCCSAGLYTESSSNGCLAGHYVFSGTHSVCAIASSKTGSMLNFGDFYDPLGQGASIGDAFQQWFALNAESGAGTQDDSRSWFYGMTIFGDPTLDTFDKALPEPPSQPRISISGDNVILNWNKSESPDINHYRIYKSNTFDQFDYSSPWHVTSMDINPLACTWTDTGAVAGNTSCFYVIRAVDHGMNQDNNTMKIGAFPTNLNAGEWKLISVPFGQFEFEVENVLGNSVWDIARTYVNSDTDSWKVYSPQRSSSLNDLAEINRENGVWLRSNSSDVLWVSGYVPEQTSIVLKAGWNLVGYPTFNETMAVSDALWGTGADRVEIFDAESPYLISEVGPEYIMKPGEGYWIHVPADTIWIIDW